MLFTLYHNLLSKKKKGLRSVLTYLQKLCFGVKFIMVALSGYEERVTNTHILPDYEDLK